MFPRIVCPTDYAELNIDGDNLICSNGHEWEIINGIPRIVIQKSNYSDALLKPQFLMIDYSAVWVMTCGLNFMEVKNFQS